MHFDLWLGQVLTSGERTNCSLSVPWRAVALLELAQDSLSVLERRAARHLNRLGSRSVRWPLRG